MPDNDTSSSSTPIWSVAANIVKARPYGPGGVEKRRGTKHFRPGAKVFVVDSFPGMCENVVVIGHHRDSARYVKMVVRVNWLENFRPQLVYSPTVIALVTDGKHSLFDQARAEEVARSLPRWVSIASSGSTSTESREDVPNRPWWKFWA